MDLPTEIKAQSPNEIILSFFDTLIYRRDLNLLTGKHWINDVLIGFFNEYMEKCVYSDHRSDFCLVHPDVVFACAAVDGSSAAEITKDLKLNEKNFVFLPCNNNENALESGGTHWSLLTYNRKENSFYSLDSWHGHNSKVAKDVAAKMESALGITVPPAFHLTEVPQQQNSFDCGMYVMCFTELLCASYLHGEVAQFDCVTPEYVMEKRKTIHDLILHLREIL